MLSTKMSPNRNRVEEANYRFMELSELSQIDTAILSACSFLIGKKELKNISVADIARQAEVAERIIYLRFSNRESILVAFFIQEINLTLMSSFSHVALNQHTRMEQNLSLIFYPLVEKFNQHQAIIPFLSQFNHDYPDDAWRDLIESNLKEIVLSIAENYFEADTRFYNEDVISLLSARILTILVDSVQITGPGFTPNNNKRIDDTAFFLVNFVKTYLDPDYVRMEMSYEEKLCGDSW